MLIGVAQRRLVIARRGGGGLVGRFAARAPLGARLVRLVLGSLLFTFFHGVVDARPARPLIRGTWGGLLLAEPGLLLRAGGGENSRGVRAATRILGARHLIEALVLSREGGRPRRIVARIDALHALSMLMLAIASPRLRRDALLSAASASALVALSLSEGSAPHARG